MCVWRGGVNRAGTLAVPVCSRPDGCAPAGSGGAQVNRDVLHAVKAWDAFVFKGDPDRGDLAKARGHEGKASARLFGAPPRLPPPPASPLSFSFSLPASLSFRPVSPQVSPRNFIQPSSFVLDPSLHLSFKRGPAKF